jgi:hypothetical protein
MMCIEHLTSPFVVQQRTERTSWGRNPPPVSFLGRRFTHFAAACVQGPGSGEFFLDTP